MKATTQIDTSHSRPGHSFAAALLFLSVLSAGALLVGADFTEVRLPGGLPLGNLLAAAVFCGLAGAAALLAPRGSVTRAAALAALLASVAWLPLSIAFAGNVSLNYSGPRGTVWLWLTAGLLLLDLGVLLFAAGASYFARRRQRVRPR